MSSAQNMVWLNGAIQPASEARIDPRDRGFLLGDGLFETILAVDGRAPLVSRHLARLASSAEVLGTSIPYASTDLSRALSEVLEVNGFAGGTAALRLTLSRGVGPRGLVPSPDSRPSVLISAADHPGPLGLPSDAALRLNLSTLRVNASSPLRRHKTLSYLENVLARREAEAQGADEALLFHTDLRVAEASAANLFASIEGALWTPAVEEGALPGITRALVLELAGEAGLVTRETRVGLADLASASEVFLTNSLMGLRPVVSLGGLPQMSDLVWSGERPVMEGLQARYLAKVGLPSRDVVSESE